MADWSQDLEVMRTAATACSKAVESIPEARSKSKEARSALESIKGAKRLDGIGEELSAVDDALRSAEELLGRAVVDLRKMADEIERVVTQYKLD